MTIDQMSKDGRAGAGSEEFVTAKIADQLFGIPVLAVRDVLASHNLTNIPLAPREVAGALNLRGRIVTAIDLRRRLGLSDSGRDKSMSIVVDHQGELYSLLIDEIGEVLSVDESNYERNPPTMDARWRDISAGIYRLENTLMIVLEVDKLLDFGVQAAA